MSIFPDPEDAVVSSATAHRDKHGKAWLIFAVGSTLIRRPIDDGAVATLHHALGVIREDKFQQAVSNVVPFRGQKRDGGVDL